MYSKRPNELFRSSCAPCLLGLLLVACCGCTYHTREVLTKTKEVMEPGTSRHLFAACQRPQTGRVSVSADLIKETLIDVYPERHYDVIKLRRPHVLTGIVCLPVWLPLFVVTFGTVNIYAPVEVERDQEVKRGTPKRETRTEPVQAAEVKLTYSYASKTGQLPLSQTDKAGRVSFDIAEVVRAAFRTRETKGFRWTLSAPLLSTEHEDSATLDELQDWFTSLP